MLVIKKVLNSSVVLIEEEGQEMIALGKGIGYSKKAGQTITKSDVSQTFLPIETQQARHLLTLIDSIPSVYFDITSELLDYVTHDNKEAFSPLLYFSITDHLYFAMERYQKGIKLTNKVFWEVKSYYSKEFEYGTYALKLIEKYIGTKFPEEEAANIAFHFINAYKTSDEPFAFESAKMISNIVNLIKYTLGLNLNEETIHYKRFITHIRFFVERFYTDKMIQDDDYVLLSQVARTCPEAVKEASKVQEYIKKQYNKVIPFDEVTYLAIHIQRLIREMDK